MFYNDVDVEQLDIQITENKEFIREIAKNGMGIVKQIAYYAKKNQNDYFEELITLKRVTDQLLPLEEYLEKPDKFIKLIN